ncbi:MAG: serine--tRNA ligase [Segetibacter sp.]
MIDIKVLREDPDRVKKATTDKGYQVDIDLTLELDGRRRSLQQKADELRAKRNEVAGKMKGGKPEPALVEEGKKIKQELATLETDLNLTEEEFYQHFQLIPNLLSEDVPIGGEELSVEIKKYGEQPTGARDHLDFMVRRDWVDFERGGKVAGTKFYFLKGDGALLENAIHQYALDFVIKKGFTYMTVPHMVNSRTALGAGFAPKSSQESNEYFIDGEDLTLIGTSEAPLTGYHADEIIDEAQLPLLYAGFSPCYRKEAGTYGKHARGLFRVHQFNKLEMYAFTLAEASQDMHENILSIEEEFWQSINIPYHVINIASGDLGAPAAKKYDIEYWSKVDGQYRELTSCSNCTDFQTRNLNIRVRRKNGTVEMLHSLNGTVASLARSLVAVVEHYQTNDETLEVPEVLQSYLGNRKVL